LVYRPNMLYQSKGDFEAELERRGEGSWGSVVVKALG